MRLRTEQSLKRSASSTSAFEKPFPGLALATGRAVLRRCRLWWNRAWQTPQVPLPPYWYGPSKGPCAVGMPGRRRVPGTRCAGIGQAQALSTAHAGRHGCRHWPAATSGGSPTRTFRARGVAWRGVGAMRRKSVSGGVDGAIVAAVSSPAPAIRVQGVHNVDSTLARRAGSRGLGDAFPRCTDTVYYSRLVVVDDTGHTTRPTSNSTTKNSTSTGEAHGVPAPSMHGGGARG